MPRLLAHRKGYTLLELLISLAAIAILAGIALPSLASMFDRNRLAISKNALVTSLQLARADSVSSGHHLVLCPSTNGSSCNSEGDWSAGWIVFRDMNRNGRPDPGDALLQRQELGHPGLQIRSSDGRRRVTYQGFGRAGGSNVRFIFCNRNNPALHGDVVVANSGRIRSGSSVPAGACG